MTHRTTTGGTTTGRARRGAVPLLVALVVTGTTATTGQAAAAPPAATTAAAGQTTDLGFLVRVSSTTLVLDRAELLTGAAADAEQRRRGLDTTPEAFVRNDNPLLRTRTLAPGVTVLGSQVLAGRPAATPVSVARLRSTVVHRPRGTTGPLFRLTLDRRGRVVRIAEVYLP